jgi:acyl carrier protein
MGASQVGAAIADEKPFSKANISAWVTNYLAKVLQVDPSSISPTDELESLGLNSALVVSMLGDLEDWLGVEISPAVVFDHPTIDAMSGFLEQAVATS